MNITTNHPGLGLKDRRILLVTSDRSKVLSLHDILAPAGYQVEEADSGAAALELYPRFEPDVVLLDVGLPDPDVFQFCRTLKRHQGEEGAPIIFITSQSDPAEVVEGLAAGGVDYLSKPFRKPEVLARIRVHLLNRLRVAQRNKNDRARNMLLCMAAHDLRNPLVSIRALTNLLRTGTAGPVTPKQGDLLNTVYDASQAMLELINDLLDVSVLEANELKLSLAPTSVAELVTASVKLTTATAADKGSRISWQPGAMPRDLVLDGPKIRQVLGNLLDNAIKFSPPGSTITVETKLTATDCSIAIRDQGPGILESDRTRLFQYFGRTSAQPTGGESSTGLGLSICQKIMRAHAGSIQAGNAPDGGAEFRITFPLPA